MEERELMTIDGYKKLEENLMNLITKFDENERAMTSSYKNSNGDGAHDNAEFEYLLSKEKMLVGQINSLRKKLDSVEVIEIEKLKENQVNIGDTIYIRMTFDESDSEELEVTLSGGEGDGINNIVSINSPLGKALYKQKIGSRVSYIVNGLDISVDIINILVKGKSHGQDNQKKINKRV